MSESAPRQEECELERTVTAPGEQRNASFTGQLATQLVKSKSILQAFGWQRKTRQPKVRSNTVEDNASKEGSHETPTTLFVHGATTEVGIAETAGAWRTTRPSQSASAETWHSAITEATGAGAANAVAAKDRTAAILEICILIC